MAAKTGRLTFQAGIWTVAVFASKNTFKGGNHE
ncbi:hypothetical protein N422_05725 [Lacticaseibacillus paracasei]|uniref:Uncharacterized protein n=1 Tax=Lacticaseibacillus paracasei N1115 TaxID=1446494 RepID=A0A806LBU0_LACPA|nr:hypothetical protein AF91_06190 [Lacticaseibacillus paracasei N1115]ERN50167.1 hypothetical protein N422_05725 [Lacticaseibacillus paracasei]